MNTETKVRAIDAPNLEVQTKGRRLAYRSMGTGKPIVLCARFRGNMDIWDPAFLDALVTNGFRVITFDYTGIGLSTGDKNFSPMAMAEDAHDLIEALDLHSAVISGWSLGGMVAQVCVATHPQRISHAVLIGTVPPGPNVKPAEQLFYDTAVIPNYTLEDEITLFFEPRSQASREAARRSVDRIAQRTQGRSNPVPVEWAAANLGNKPRSPLFPADAVLTALKATRIPLLHIGGDHDIIFPVENWYALNQELPTLQLLTYPQAGHGPHHQHPEAVAQYMATFVNTTSA
jgi:pimeloyl-ACP methyl ester carboxylesterase